MNYNKTFQGSKRLLIDGIVGRENSVSTYIQERKLSETQDLAYNLIREFDKISDNFYQAAKAYESSEDRINNLVNINKNNDIKNIIAINSMENTYFNSDDTKNQKEDEITFNKLKELSQKGWKLLKDYCGLYVSDIDFIKHVCDNINTLIDGYLKDHVLLENPEETLSENLRALNMIRAIICPMTKEEYENNIKAYTF